MFHYYIYTNSYCSTFAVHSAVTKLIPRQRLLKLSTDLVFISIPEPIIGVTHHNTEQYHVFHLIHLITMLEKKS